MIDEKIYPLNAQASPTELKQIKMFQSRAEKLLKNSLVVSGFGSSAELNIDHDHGFKFTSYQLPSEEGFESLLMRFRHFWLKEESCNFFKILNIVSHRVPEIRGCTSELRMLWERGLFCSTNIVIDNVELTSQKVIDLWLSSEFFHNNEVKKLELEQLIERTEEALNSPELLRFILVGSICKCCNVIFDLNELLKKIQFSELPS